MPMATVYTCASIRPAPGVGSGFSISRRSEERWVSVAWTACRWQKREGPLKQHAVFWRQVWTQSNSGGWRLSPRRRERFPLSPQT